MSDDLKNSEQTFGSGEPDRLLPWYVNGTLNEVERARVEAHLESHPEAQREVEFLRRLAEQNREHQPESPGELGLHRLKRDIRRQQRAGSNGVSKYWRPLAIAASLVLAIQSALLIWPQDRGELQLAGGPETADIQVTFVPEASEESIRELLQEIGAEIVAGPGELGVYRLAFDRNTDIKQALAKLRAHDHLVSYASRS